MKFELGKIFIDEVRFGEAKIFREGEKRVLVFNPTELISYLKNADERLAEIKVHIVNPGDSTWLICVKDVIEPRFKKGKCRGQGRTQALANVAVVTCGQIVAFQEGIIPMSGPGADYTPFSKTINVALEIDVIDGTAPHAHEGTIRLAGLRAAKFLGEIASRARPSKIDRYSFDLDRTTPKNLPRVVYVCMLLSQGLLHDNYVFGRDAKDGRFLPCVIAPTAVLDGVIVSGNCVSACDKNTTWHHQNNSVVRELFGQHGKTFNFVGMVLTNEPTKLSEKQRSAEIAIELVKRLGAQIVIITEEGFGNPEADLMMLVRGLDQAGIKTVAITDEYAGSDGASQSLADTTPGARAIISVGNANELIVLPPPEKIIGPIQDLTKLAGAYPQSLRKDGSLEIELQAIVGATNQLGFQKLSCRGI